MTDTYGTEPHDHEHGHDEILTHEHDAVREPPSDYEFSDDHSATVAEEQNEEHVPLTSEIKAGHRSPALPIIAAAGGLLLLGAVAWWQFGGTHSSAAQGAIALTPQGQIASTVPAAMDLPKSDVPNSTVAATTAATPEPIGVAPSSPANGSAAAALQMLAPSAAPTPSAPMVAPASAPVIASSPAASPAAALPIAVVPGPLANPMPASADVNHRIDSLTTRLDDLQKALDQTTQQLGQVTNMVSATTASNGAPTADVKERLDRIDQQLATLHRSAPKLAVPATLPSAASVTPAPSDVPVTTHPSKEKTHHVALVSKAHGQKHEAAKAVPVTKASSWVLRAASPGQAWVSSDKSSHDLKQVQVGDTFDGIGKVSSVTQSNGVWVVQGTKGTIQ